MDLLRETRPGKIAPPTVYRALDFLLEQGLVHRINSINAFIGCPFGDSEHSHSPCFFICTQCQETAEIELPVLEQGLKAQAAQQGFRIGKQSVEITGLCQRCCLSVSGGQADE